MKAQEDQRSGIRSVGGNKDSQDLLEISKVELKNQSKSFNELDSFAYRPEEKRKRVEPSSIEDPDAVRS